jgi:hypothetical protein
MASVIDAEQTCESRGCSFEHLVWRLTRYVDLCARFLYSNNIVGWNAFSPSRKIDGMEAPLKCLPGSIDGTRERKKTDLKGMDVWQVGN